MGISFSRLGLNIDVNSRVSHWLALERRPLDKLQSTQIANINAEITSFGKISSDLSALSIGCWASTPESF